MSFDSSSIDHYQISITDNIDLIQTKKEWENLEKNPSIPFFLTWAWMSIWIESYTPQLCLVKAVYQNKVVALGFLTSSTERRHFVINAKQLRLHQTGIGSQDQVWVEYNDFICDKDHKIAASNACIKYISKCDIFNTHDEFIISMILSSRAENITKQIPKSQILFTRPCYGIDFEVIKQQEKPYLQTLKSNTRYQIRRSIRHYEKLHGNVTLEHANSTENALKYFHETASYHIQRWYDSGFKNPEFMKFHESLISKYFDQGLVHLIKVKAGETVIAILYYFIHNSNVSFYLQGLLYEHDKMLKPGLVAHSLATQYFIDQGMRSYDYMGGYSQYKTQLAHRTEDLATIRIQKPILKFILENTAQTIKSVVTRKPK